VTVGPADFASADPGPMTIEIPGRTALLLTKVAQAVGVCGE
jgi:hypothetical protein